MPMFYPFFARYPMITSISAVPSIRNDQSLSLSRSNSSGTRMHITRDRERAESALFEHVKKAVNSQETAPKQKHVRGKKSEDGANSL